MVTIRLHQTTTATPEQFLAGLTDFGPDRSKIFPNSKDGYLKVHDQGPTEANMLGRRSGHTYTLTPQPGGTTDIDVVVIREGKNLKGRLFEILLTAGGKRILARALATTVKAIEARNSQPTQAPS